MPSMQHDIERSANPANLGCGFLIVAAITAALFWLAGVTEGVLSGLCTIAAWFMLVATALGLLIGVIAFIYANYLKAKGDDDF